MRFLARPATLVAVLATVLASAYVAVSAPAPASASGPAHAPAVDAYGDTPGDATMYARAMVRQKGQGGVRARKASGDLTERPNFGADEQVKCAATVPICVHYTTRPGSPDAVAATWPQTVLDQLTHIYGVYQSSGYRMPEADGTVGPAQKTVQTNGQPVPVNDVDIYLKNVGSQGYYGYCVPDAPQTGRAAGTHDTPAFCVLDNDYKEFPNGTPLTNMEVTAAHEFFHAVQFSYDAWEDSWFMEATAVWMEDEVYTGINDNTQYLPFGPMGKPAQSLDKPTTFGVYGAWSFFRWLTEHRPATTGQLPRLILQMWQRADSAGGADSDHYSLQAVSHVLKKAHLPIAKAFAEYTAANRNPTENYAEGAANHYPVAKPAKKVTLKPSHKRTAASFRVDHLAAATERFKPKSLSGKKNKLRLSVDMADKKLGSGAIATAFLRNGSTRVKTVKLSTHGNGAVTMPFSSRKVKRVELTLSNASTRMNCWTQKGYSCDGTPKDMNVRESLTASLRR